jgi:methylmalonyl-CoA/ethylmalonyl-CoA epimerase
MKFHHIGIATYNINDSISKYLLFGYNQITVKYFDPIQNVNITFMEKDNSPMIEFVEPVDEKSPILNTLTKNGTTPYHFCFEVDDIHIEVEKLKKNKFILISKVVPAVAFNNRLVCFLYSKESGLIELLNKL